MRSVQATTANPPMPFTAARGAMVASITTVLLLALLHLLSPEFNPNIRMVSEYALGNYGWVLSLMFIAWSLSCITLFFAIKGEIRTVGGKIGLGFLLVSAVGMAMASVFDVSHSLHGLAGLIGMPTLPIAAMLISVSLLRNPTWASSRSLLLWTANLTWFSLVLMVASIGIGLSQGGTMGVDVFVGWPNRFLIVAYCLWTASVAWRAGRLRER